MAKRLVLAALLLLVLLASANGAEEIKFKGTGKASSGDPLTLTGRLFKPQGNGPFPGVVLMHGCAGISPFNTWPQRLASWGYVAFQVDSFGPRGKKNICRQIMSVPFHVRTQDAYDAKDYLAGLSFVDRNRIALMGWSHGGVTTLSTVSNSNYAAWAGANPSRKQEDTFRAAIAFYPFCDADLGDANAPLLILVGDMDDWCPAALCQQKMPPQKAAHEIILKIYSGAHHGFDMEGLDLVQAGHRVLYNPQALADSIVQVREFLGKHLK